MHTREKLLLGFRPLHPAVRYFCQLCGVEVSNDSSLKRTARKDTFGEDVLHSFCTRCSPEVDRIANLMAHESARLDAEAANSRDGKLKEIAAYELELLEVSRLHDGGGSSAPPSDERTSPRSSRHRAPRKGMIPNPADASS